MVICLRNNFLLYALFTSISKYFKLLIYMVPIGYIISQSVIVLCAPKYLQVHPFCVTNFSGEFAWNALKKIVLPEQDEGEEILLVSVRDPSGHWVQPRRTEEQKPKEMKPKASENKPVMTE
uniref:Uncharacterized protein LOC109505421 n=1 Tax=Elaeis guineensis var. tenera TaxID=51953 RepID=A0A6J0PFQ6_ELAGV|nr:uncharacterized protein LOC109505421 [Elaeis guineensis]